MKEVRILGVGIDNRLSSSVKIQEVLSKYGCSIKTRLGLHEVTAESCSTTGLVLLELSGDGSEWDKLESDLKALAGVKVEKMIFH